MQNIGFELVQNKKIFFISNELDTKKIVILSHGFRGSNIGPAREFVEFEALLNLAGFSTLRFDQYGNGNSDGDHIDSSFNHWIEVISHFANMYLDRGYQVILLGQSMGATATMATAAKDIFKDRIPCILLWVPDPKQNIQVNPDQVYEEAGQKYKGNFWLEAKNTKFYECLETYKGGIHLVYGEKDVYVAEDVRQTVIAKVEEKKQPFMILKGQGHSPWESAVAKRVYAAQLQFIQQHVNS